MIREQAIEARPSPAAAEPSDFMTPEALDRLASDLHVVAERLRRAAAFRDALARSDPSDEDDRIDYLHT